jgi:type VI secretion system protein ImpE
MNPKQLFEAGDLTGAIDAVTRQVKAHPTDAAARTFLFELLCFAGELDRAEKQLAVIAEQNAESEWGATVYGNILQAERARRRLFSDGQPPEFLLDPPQSVRWHLEAIDRLRENRPAEAMELLARAEEERPLLAGRLGEESFADFRDCDDVLAPVLELIVLNDYVWIPLEQIRELEIAPPERPRDLVWAPVQLVLQDDSQRRGYVPVLYPDSHRQADDRIRLGRLTDWQSTADGPTRGIGLRTFLCGDDALGLFDLKTLRFSGGS